MILFVFLVALLAVGLTACEPDNSPTSANSADLADPTDPADSADSTDSIEVVTPESAPPGMTEDPPSASDTRGFSMGFTPWLYEASFDAEDRVYEQIQSHGDIVSHHLMSGIPWQAALDGSSYHVEIENRLARRLSKTQDGMAVYLSLDSLNGPRTELAPNWGALENEARSGAWASRSFASVEVISAYTRFASDMIERFNPRYFNYAVEVGGLMTSNPTAFDDFVVFAEAVSGSLRQSHPTLPLMVSLSLKSPGSAEMQTVRAGFARIADYVDAVGISVYPYAFYDHANKGDPTNLPGSWLRQIHEIAPGKPVAITETAWAGEDLLLPSFGISVPMTVEDQARFVDVVLSEADTLNAAFVIWFSLFDYDALWETVLAEDAVGRIWRDTGLFDEHLNPRPAMTNWDTTFAIPLQLPEVR